MRDTKILGIGNHKGGTCKTANAVHLAAALGERGHKCLVIDLDPNLGLTVSFDIPINLYGTCEMLLREVPIEEVIISTESDQERASRPGEPITLPKNVDVIPASRRIEYFDEEFAKAVIEDKSLKYVPSFDTLVNPLKAIAGKYDWVILDTPPSAGTLTAAAYKVSRWFILSTTPEKKAVQALERAVGDIDIVKDVNPDLQIAGVIVSRLDYRKKLQKTYINKVKRDMSVFDPYGLFEPPIPDRAVVGKASTLDVTVFDYEPIANEIESTNEIRNIYRSYAEELENRVNSGVRLDDVQDEDEAGSEVANG